MSEGFQGAIVHNFCNPSVFSLSFESGWGRRVKEVTPEFTSSTAGFSTRE
jgi:hypothetical protein